MQDLLNLGLRSHDDRLVEQLASPARTSGKRKLHVRRDEDGRIVVPVTALPGPEAGEPTTEMFALEALGQVLVSTLRIWAQAGPEAAEGIACAVIDFVLQFLTDDHEDVAEVLHQLEAVGVGQALAAHPAPAGAHLVRLSIA
ncbi:hypothetical protein [Streptomyces sp. NBC_00158]|uniref:hypothetical protein n=1 Tax=Streptomyces sp. NBC_00158 TaxID=2903627 RepID=UPI002F90F88C